MVNPPTIAPACAAAERRHLGVWSACAAEGKCIAPNAHIVLLQLDLVCNASFIEKTLTRLDRMQQTRQKEQLG